MSSETSVLLLWLVLIQEGAAIRPAVTFSPNYRKIFTTERITMTCDGGSAIGEDVTYSWYKDKRHVHSGKYYTIQRAETSHSGNYQCQTRPGERSDPARLDVSNGWLILQTPLHVYEGDEITIRCHHYPGYNGGRTIFYKDDSIIRDWAYNAEYYIGNVTRTTAGTYGCRKEVYHRKLFDNLNEDKDDTYVSVEELFRIPEIKITWYPETEGDPMTLTCETSLSPYRQTKELQFAFYREGQNIQGFNTANKYGVQSVQMAGSGRYFCEVTTSDERVRKRSNIVTIIIKELFTTPTITVTPHPVLQEDNMTLKCETSLPPPRQNTQLRFTFHKEGRIVQGLSINDIYEVYNVQLEDSGKYSCNVSTTDGRVRKRSAELSLQIQELFSHLNITVTKELFEGDLMTLTCDTTLSPHINVEVQFAFYRDGQEVQGFTMSNKYKGQSVHLEDSGNYTCEVKTSTNNTMRRSYESTILVKELFSPPVLKVSPELVNEGDNMALICETNLSEHRPDTRLQYVFYTDQRNVEQFNSSNKYEVEVTRMDNSGTYTCEIQTSTGSVKKRSQELLIQVQRSDKYSQLTILSVSLGLLLFIIILFIFLYVHYQRRSSHSNVQPTTDTHNEFLPEDEVSYAVLAMTSRPQSHVPTDNGSSVVYATVKSDYKEQVKGSQATSDTSTDIYQNIGSHR